VPEDPKPVHDDDHRKELGELSAAHQATRKRADEVIEEARVLTGQLQELLDSYKEMDAALERS